MPRRGDDRFGKAPHARATVARIWAIIHSVTTDANSTRAGRITVRRYASAAEADQHDLEFWMQMPDTERVLHVWTLSRQLWQLRGELVDESGLCRSVASVRRR